MRQASCSFRSTCTTDLLATQQHCSAVHSYGSVMRGHKARCLQGHVGAPPPEGALIAAALTQHEMYIYCGHGAGEQYLPVHKLRRLPSCAALLLMGCSSGRLSAAGSYDASGPLLGYLLAGGSMHAVSALTQHPPFAMAPGWHASRS